MTAEVIIANEQELDSRALPENPRAAVGLFGTDDPMAVIERATAVSKAIMEIVRTQKLSVQIGPKKHLLVEAWVLMGSMVGVSPVVVWTRPLERDGKNVGWEARVECVRNGAVVSAAEAMCSRDETTWAKRDEFALRSMAQTRATSKALATCLRFIAVLAGFAGTPAEEMPRGDAQSGHAGQSTKRWADYPKSGVGSLCAVCAKEGLMSTTGAPPTIRKSKQGTLQCNGRTNEVVKDGERGWMNHPAPLAEGEEVSDDTPIPFN